MPSMHRFAIFHHVFFVSAVTWHKGHRDLSYDYRHRVTVFQNMHAMEIQEVMVTDAGEYIARATNACGVTEARCQIKVNRRMGRRARSVTRRFLIFVNF